LQEGSLDTRAHVDRSRNRIGDIEDACVQSSFDDLLVEAVDDQRRGLPKVVETRSSRRDRRRVLGGAFEGSGARMYAIWAALV
jgi:hypothetical protein